MRSFRQMAIVFCLACSPALASDAVMYPGAKPAPDVDAKAWVLMDFQSGQVVAGVNHDAQYPPASITKLMTNYVLFDALSSGRVDLADQVAISEAAWRAEGSRMFAEVNSKVSLESLLKSTVIQSGNDAAIALAEHTAGSEASFAELMNTTAKALGLSRSSFANSTGLPAPEHLMSARDIGTLSAAIVRDFPNFYSWYAEKSFRHNGITQYNRNKLLWKDASVDGLKTGHTEAAGYCLVGTAKRDEQRWVAVVLGSSNERTREKAVLDLLNYGFNTFESYTVLDGASDVSQVRVFGGEQDTLSVRVQKSVSLVVPKGREKDVQPEFQISPYYLAPLEAGQAVGVATFTLDGKEVATMPLVAAHTIAQGPWWKRLLDVVKLKLFELFPDSEE